MVESLAALESASAIRSLLDFQGNLATETVATLNEDCKLERHVALVSRNYQNHRVILAGSLRRDGRAPLSIRTRLLVVGTSLGSAESPMMPAPRCRGRR